MRITAWLLVVCVGCTTDKGDSDGSSGGDTSSARPYLAVDPEWALSAGHSHSCGINGDGAVVCWGISDGDWNYGQVSNAPDGTFQSVTVGGYFSCGVRTSGGLHSCWGEDRGGPSTGSVDLAYINGGVDHACAIQSDGDAFCFGDDGYGETLAPAGRFLQISAGYRHSCGIRDDGNTACWGRDHKGQASLPEVEFVQVSAGAYQSCGIDITGALHCWGELVEEPPAGTYSQVSAARSGSHACALNTDGKARCWGYNEWGQASPPSGTFSHISAGGTHSCARTDEGTFVCWGNNPYGQASPP